jgi:thioredoxin
MTTEAANTEIRELAASTWDEATATTEILLVDFWAPWCGPCLVLGPVLEEYAATHPSVVLAKVNIDTNEQLAQRFQIMSIPTVMLYVRGEKVLQFTGAISSGELARRLSSFVK